MLIKADAKALEWRAKVCLAHDKVAIAEILDPARDIHAENQKDFKLPTRTVSKNFLFRAIFADSFGEQGCKGPAHAYVRDPKFSPTSTSVRFWTRAIESFYDKYQGVYKHSVSIIREACETGKVLSPSGRRYSYKTYINRNGTPEWPRTQILNHVVQGFSADVMIFARRYAYKYWNSEWGLLINTVHDDIEADVHNNPEVVFSVCTFLEDAFKSIEEQTKKWYGFVLDVPVLAECKFGLNLYEDSMSKFSKETFQEDYNLKFNKDINE